MNADLPDTLRNAPNVAGPTNGFTNQASFTGGAPGSPVPTYAWQFLAPSTPATPVSFQNPAGASSQIVRFENVPEAAPFNVEQYSVAIRVTITDRLGNQATDDATSTVKKTGPTPPGPIP